MPPSTYLHVRKCERFGSFFPLIFCRVQQTARTNSVAFSQLCGDLIVVDVKCVVYRPRRILFAFTTPQHHQNEKFSKLLGLSDGGQEILFRLSAITQKGVLPVCAWKLGRACHIYIVLLLCVCAWGKRENLNRLDLEERESEKVCPLPRLLLRVRFDSTHFLSLLFSSARGSTSSSRVIMRVLLPTARPFPPVAHLELV